MSENQIIKKIFKMEILSLIRNKGDFFNILVFFVLISTVWILAIPADLINLNKIGPSVIWVSLLFVIYLNILFRIQNIFWFHKIPLDLQKSQCKFLQ